MRYIEWQDWMAVGIPLIDADHKVLISLINQVHACIGDAQESSRLGDVLRALEEYTEHHFRREEKLAEEVGFPGLTAHKALHAHLTAQVREMVHRYEMVPGSTRAVDVQSFLERWLIDHVCRHDMAIKKYALGREDAEAVAATVGIADIRDNPTAGRIDWSALHILVVDDNSNFVALMETVLKGVGIGQVLTAKSAAEGLEILSREPIDIVLSDWQMVGPDGMDFTKSIRLSLDPLISNVGIMMVSGHGTEGFQQKALLSGADDFMIKPISIRELLQGLARIIDARRN